MSWSGDQNPPLLLYSLNVQLMREQQEKAIKEAYLEIALKLKKAGAEALIICANTPHLVYDWVQPQISIPILHIAQAIANKAKEAGYRNLGLLGTLPTMQGKFLSEPLKQMGISCRVPGQQTQQLIHQLIARELTQGRFLESTRDYFLEQVLTLQKEGADAVILGCTEIPMLIDQKNTSVPLLDTTGLHAEMAVKFILGEG